MAPTNQQLWKRDYCNGDPNCLDPGSPWYDYGRWILLAIVIGLVIIAFAIFSFISSRRRRRLGDNPLPMTGWASRPDASQWEQGYKKPPQHHHISPDGQETGVTQPPPAYTGGETYAPPPGPPPTTKN